MKSCIYSPYLLLLFTGPIDFTRDVVTYLLVVGTVIAVAFDGSVRHNGSDVFKYGHVNFLTGWKMHIKNKIYVHI